MNSNDLTFKIKRRVDQMKQQFSYGSSFKEIIVCMLNAVIFVRYFKVVIN